MDKGFSISYSPYLSGTLKVDFPEDIRIIENFNKYETVKVSGTSVKFSYCPLEKGMAVLRDQYGVGTLTAKIIVLKPVMSR